MMQAGRRIFLSPGEVAWSEEPTTYKTVLGSCISVCLWDLRHRIGGLNHFILPQARAGEDDPRFGNVAIPRLIAGLRSLGCFDLVAKVFGGATVLRGATTRSVGEANTDAALAWLGQESIPVVAQRTGGETGIVILFESASGEVLVRDTGSVAAAGLQRTPGQRLRRLA
jgi:chemotaxis protein CheD